MVGVSVGELSLIFLFLLGCSLLVFGFWPFMVYWRFSPYGLSRVRIIDCVVIHEEGFGFFSPIDLYRIDVAFEYSLIGEKYKSNRIGFYGKGVFSSEEKAMKVKEKVANSSCFYFSKKDPSFGYILRSSAVGDRDGRYGFLAAGMLVLVVSLYFGFGVHKKRALVFI